MGIETALGLLGAGLQYKQYRDQKKTADKIMANAGSPLTWEQAMTQSKQINDPIWDNKIESSLQESDNDAMRRGFYGQLPGDALRSERELSLEQGRQAAIADLAARMQGNSEASYTNQMNLALGTEQDANKYLNSAFQTLLSSPVLPTFGGFGKNPPTETPSSKPATLATGVAGIGTATGGVAPFINPGSSSDTSFDKLYGKVNRNTKKTTAGNYTNPYGG